MTGKFQINDGKCTMICDSKGALASAFGYKHINPRWQCYDLLCMIKFLLHNSPIQWRHEHVKGHQDDNTTYKNLDLLSQANVDLNKLAKIELRRNRPVDDTQVLPGQCWQIRNRDNDELIHGDIESSIRTVLYKERMKQFWVKKF